MDSVKLLRQIFILLTVIVILAVFLIIFQLTDLGFRAYDRLSTASPWLIGAYLLMVAVIAGTGLFLIIKIWTIGRRKPKSSNAAKPKATAEALRTKLNKARAQGADVAAIEADLEVLSDEPPTTLEIAFFGKISTGKSSLIRTLLPNAHVETSVIGGSTAAIERFHYTTEHGLSLTLIDMPGTHQAQTIASLDNSVMQAARRVHIVCYVLDQDITASDQESIALLHQFGKPLVVILNKSNRYDEAERALLKERIQSRIPADAQLVLAASAYPQEVKRIAKDGTVSFTERLTGGDIHPLLKVFAQLEGQRGELGKRQQQALLELADDSLAQTLGAFRRERGQAMVKAYSRKAMLGGVAAVGPGTDVLIQGYLGMDMLKALTKLYDVPAQEIDLQSLLETISGKIKSQVTLVLALAGNVCKAFPGVGTVLGGASHAVAYGLIFESLGQAVLTVLEQNDGKLTSQNILQQFETQINKDLESRAIGLVKTVMLSKKEDANE
ncbi:GTPase [Suttonella ornithocola]|uniref:GTP-binding protein YsxC n=1 Tax=Suttonella ornithocola TaxID=279832 RepID=A0A380MRY0_9GAMM|nr:GTPase [Suttonella ornithocola]SUO95399.1 GTP-binding protein YsxC [Suttonella ornithocola]